jgi:pimeloyl-ACP methyl ester carboxylesterase
MLDNPRSPFRDLERSRFDGGFGGSLRSMGLSISRHSQESPMRAYRLPDYMVSGESDTTMYMLHGAYGSKEYFRFTIERFVAYGLRVVACDMPGYGISEVPESVSIAGMADMVNRLVEATGTRRNVMLGHSMGGMVAQKAADLQPDRFAALVLSATAHTFNHSGPQWQAEFLRTRVAPLTQGKSIAEYAPAMLRTMMGPDASDPALDHALYNIRMMKGAAFQKAIQAISGYLEDDVPARLKMPVLCIAGELDLTCPASVMKRMAEMMPLGEFHEMKGVGHYGWGERHEEYHRVVDAFLDRALGSRPG